MTDDTVHFALGPIMKIEDCEQLHTFLSGATDKSIEIDCSMVERLGGLTAQMLAMASIAWPSKDLQARFANPSPAFAEGIEHLGLSGTIQTDQVAG